jgi:5-methylcytosine rRNA methyltransferase NSUN4
LQKALLAESVHHDLKIHNKSYYLDEASVWAAQALQVKPYELVLDMCAAPGGKSLVLASALQGTGTLQCNELSATRRGRLKRVLAEHLPLDWQQSICVSSHDASKWGLYQKDHWDAILLDAPCSSEQHVLKSASHLAQWSSKRSKRLAIQQFAMLAAALDAVKPGGRIVYSTCALSRQENDGVIEKLLKKREGMFTLPPPHGVGESTEYGRMILPDVYAGKGPIYYCVLVKN